MFGKIFKRFRTVATLFGHSIVLPKRRLGVANRTKNLAGYMSLPHHADFGLMGKAAIYTAMGVVNLSKPSR